MPTNSCLNCAKEFRWHPSQHSGKYCSNSCQIDYRLNEAIASGNYTKHNAKTYFKRNTEYKCSDCGITDEYNGKPIVLQIDHIDGNHHNDKVENYRYLCPNCHSQTETWGNRNISEDARKRMNEGGVKGRLSRGRK